MNRPIDRSEQLNESSFSDRTWLFRNLDVTGGLWQVWIGPPMGAFLFIGYHLSGEFHLDEYGLTMSSVLVLYLMFFTVNTLLLDRPFGTGQERIKKWVYIRGISRVTIALRYFISILFRAFVYTFLTAGSILLIAGIKPLSGFLRPLHSVSLWSMTVLELFWCTFSIYLIVLPLYQVLRNARMVPLFPDTNSYQFEHFKNPVFLFRVVYMLLISCGILGLFLFGIKIYYYVYLILSPVLVPASIGLFLWYFSRVEFVQRPSLPEYLKERGTGRTPVSSSRSQGAKTPLSKPFHPLLGMFWQGVNKWGFFLPVIFLVVPIYLFGSTYSYNDTLVINWLFQTLSYLTMFMFLILLPLVYQLFLWNVDERTGRYLFQAGLSLGTLLRYRQLSIGFISVFLLFLFQMAGFHPAEKPEVLSLFSLVTIIAFLQTAPVKQVMKGGRYAAWAFHISLMLGIFVPTLLEFDATAFLDQLQVQMQKHALYLLLVSFCIFLINYFCSFNEQWLRKSFIYQREGNS